MECSEAGDPYSHGTEPQAGMPGISYHILKQIIRKTPYIVALTSRYNAGHRDSTHRVFHKNRPAKKNKKNIRPDTKSPESGDFNGKR